MNSETKLAMAEAMNGTMLTAEQAEGEDLKLMIVGQLGDFIALGQSPNQYNKDAVLADIGAETPEAIREELGRMGFAKHLGQDGYAIVNPDEWETYIDEAKE